jgi:hypothetical protein
MTAEENQFSAKGTDEIPVLTCTLLHLSTLKHKIHFDRFVKEKTPKNYLEF